jgi:hypothetical protein
MLRRGLSILVMRFEFETGIGGKEGELYMVERGKLIPSTYS